MSAESLGTVWFWLGEQQNLLLWLGLSSLAMFIGSLLLLPLIVVRLPADYFHPDRELLSRFARTHPLVRVLLKVAKNLLGVSLIMGGILMLVLPGQGLLTLLIGISLTDFPGKRAWERRLAAQPPVLKTLNWLRRRAGRDEFELGLS